jgi:hypothetical protein
MLVIIKAGFFLKLLTNVKKMWNKNVVHGFNLEFKDDLLVYFYERDIGALDNSSSASVDQSRFLEFGLANVQS